MYVPGLFEVGYDVEFQRLIASVDPVLRQMTGIGKDQLDPYKQRITFHEATTVADYSVDSNANVAGMSAANIMQERYKANERLDAMFWIWKDLSQHHGRDYATRIINKFISGELYPADLHMFTVTPYCYAFSVEWLMQKGLPFIPKIKSEPAKHADAFLHHVEQLLMYASNHQSGAVAVPGMFPALAWYAKRDRMTDAEIVQELQSFTYTCNQPVRYSVQAMFVNLALLDRVYLKELYGHIMYPDASDLDIEYTIHLQKLYLEWLVKDIRDHGNIFTFPILTAMIFRDPETGEVVDKDFYEWVTDANSSYGNVNFYQTNDPTTISSCCRLSNDFKKLQRLGYLNAFGSGGDSIGSVGVCTINLPHIAFSSETESEFYERLEENVLDARNVTLCRRRFVQSGIEQGLLPLYQHGFIQLDKQYCTVGINGLWEAGWRFGKNEDVVGAYVEFGQKVANVITHLLEGEEAKDRIPTNLEQVPGESLSVKLAKKDRYLGLQEAFHIYSNQWLPLIEDVPVYDRLKVAGQLDRYMSGGAITHITTGRAIPGNMQRRLLDEGFSEGIPYMAFNAILSSCCYDRHVAEYDARVCPKCGGNNLKKYTRVVGFITPVDNWSRHRREEFVARQRYGIEDLPEPVDVVGEEVPLSE